MYIFVLWVIRGEAMQGGGGEVGGGGTHTQESWVFALVYKLSVFLLYAKRWLSASELMLEQKQKKEARKKAAQTNGKTNDDGQWVTVGVLFCVK